MPRVGQVGRTSGAASIQGLVAQDPDAGRRLARADDGGIGLLRTLTVAAGQELTDRELRLDRGANLVVRSRAERDCQFTLHHDGLAVGHGFVGPGKTSQQTLFPGATRVRYTLADEEGR